LTSAFLDLGRDVREPLGSPVEERPRKMRMKKPGLIACLGLAIALTAPPVAESASPVRGVWKGKETKYWTGSKWERYSLELPVSFRIERGEVVRFRTSGTYQWTGCTSGATVTAKLPTTREANVRHGQFRSERTTYAGSRKMTTHVSGRLASAGRARGKIVVNLAGCPTYRSVWKATRPKRKRRRSGGGGIHIPLCRGQNILLPDGTYYYNPCAYVAGRGVAPALRGQPPYPAG
jgi:hypothetical protein